MLFDDLLSLGKTKACPLGFLFTEEWLKNKLHGGLIHTTTH